MSSNITPTADEFVKVLKQYGTHWFDIGVYLGASTEKLKEIRKVYTSDGVVTCLTELYDCLAKKGKLTWESIATVLRELDNHALADSIHCNYILPAIHRALSNENSTTSTTVQPVRMDIPTSDCQVVTIKDKLIDEIGEAFQSLSDHLSSVTLKICQSAVALNINIQQMQALIDERYGLPPLPQATIEKIVYRLRKQECSILDFRPLVFIVSNFLCNDETLQTELAQLKASVDSFKGSAKMIDLVSLIVLNQYQGDDVHRKVELKVRESFWKNFTMKQFEIMMNAILDELYDELTHVRVVKGSICVIWIIPPSVDYTKLLPKLSPKFLQLLQIIGVISLRIGDDVICNVGEEGCQTLEAAMLQAIELKNTQAIELLLAVGCSPEVATYNGDHAVTNVVNIRERSVYDDSGGGVDHVCVLGHNEHIEAIIDPSREPKCATCRTKEKQNKQLHMQVNTLQLENKKLRDPQQKELKNEALSSEYDAKKGVDIFY